MTLHKRYLIGALVYGAVLIAAAVLVMSEARTLQVIGVAILCVFLLVLLVADGIEAAANERHVERYPELLRNDPVGETVTACGDFLVTGGVATGIVSLRGEKWKARASPDRVPRDGEIMSVRSREGLTLQVQIRR